MPTSVWNRILEEFYGLRAQDQQNPRPGPPNRVDQDRREKISAIEKITNTPLVIYATACTTPAKGINPEVLMMDSSDRIGFKTVTDVIDPPYLDILIHSPGGYPDATESIVQQLRSKYSKIRFFVPSYAKSAATMLVMSGNEILMDQDAELGPIDPQIRTPNGISPAETILEQFTKAQVELQKDASKLPSWLPILTPLGPSLLVDAQHAIALSKTLVKTWVKDYMLAGEPDAEVKSAGIANFLGDHARFKSHGRAVKIPDLLPLGVKVTNIRSTPALFAAVDELYCCLDILLGNSPVYKIFENSAGHALIRQQQRVEIPQMLLQRQPNPPANPTQN